ncbi:hypothetical protein SAMN04488102_102204 [Alkalibacterium subtropicum]|uniref:Uncharacterized protein n=1 Tax=Alkalibacterium subtropicum TaxID=753702 RepID=A0A1I1FQG1_9LACT|nr:hypothetical protein [Alkalibacterium subtropicum]SFC01575.1 hypothetical protein SAMN04488102_102204 [Alkalibacterium subtropicum]
MKRLIFSLLFVVLVLTGCNLSQEGFSEIENLPNKVQETVDPEIRLQAITDEGKGYYIVFHSSGEVETEVEVQEETMLINLTESNLQEDNIKQHTYYLATTPKFKMMEVFVNGVSTPFDNITLQ